MNYLRLLQLRRMANMMAPDAGGSGAAGGQGQNPGQSGAQTGEGGDGKGTESGGDEGAKSGEKTFTQADIDQIIREEQAKWMRQQKKAVSEAERLAKLSTEERAAEEARVREENLTKREAEITRRELRAQALSDLATQQMPAELADLLDYTDADACSESIKKIKGVWQKAVQKGVEARVKGGAPKAGDNKDKAPNSLRDAIAGYYKK
ncbi:MAG: DUF4355 domain-containing protein [Clostridia bacterium]|nr:DUF4355 domain-containing protein [Clostridia bacterium]